ncbi:MAG: SDR family oxidoreductase [Flavobacteriales bacterium]|nr:SDR family oxidoreductase [Flavobacteriales bacterium]MCW8911861.1 SDR family oxidoreductase [Flavobacteriales bacterium]MCW8936368.1 SDR family oxidoreductase [Flavobacteriales bacterium]MCW8939662.1 SDR family oxidoreductase [Flavobacteriales bacterium]MCW8969522.1 SDR family oxidoreductase [Flavobacteriales bacterium]
MDKRVAIITGAAKGIGKAISERMVKENYVTILVDVDNENGITLAKKLGDSAKYIFCDISNHQEVENLFKTVVDEYGGIDVLVNNAGIIRDNVIWKMPEEDFDKVMDVNLKGTWLMCKVAGTLMREQKKGRIVNIASRAWLGNRGQSNYSASKAGVVGLTRVLALELGKYGVLVNAIAPGLIDTPLTQKLPQDVQDKLIEAQPTKTMGKPEDIANAVSFLCDDKTQFITGQTIYVDGGKSIGAGL